MSTQFYKEGLAAAEERLVAFSKRVFPGQPLDHGMLQLEQEKRGGSINSQIDEWKRLSSSVAYWKRKLRAAENRAAAQGLRDEKAEQHDAADLKTQYGECSEVLWALSGRWHRVKRWNRKSVTVEGLTETIPHTQVAGAR